MNRRLAIAVICVLGFTGCGSPQPEEPQFPDANDPAYAASFDGEVDPRVSTSAGEAGGVVVLWPRVVPGDDSGAVSEQAAMVQERLRAAVEKALPGLAIDVRPSPERACSVQGCKGLAVGAVLAHSGRGCAVAATLSRPGQSPVLIVPWSSTVGVRSSIIQFRDPPESQLVVRDYASCEALAEDLAGRDAAVEAALTEAGAELRGADGEASGQAPEAPAEPAAPE